MEEILNVCKISNVLSPNKASKELFRNLLEDKNNINFEEKKYWLDGKIAL